VTRVTAPDLSATTTSYSGNTTTVTDPAGKRKKFTYDAFGNLTQVAEPDAQGNLTVLTNYTYDTVGRLTDVWMNGTAQHRQFTYNDLGQVTAASNPENGTVSYAYNADGTLASKTDAKNQTTLFQYDTYKRLTRIYPGGSYGYEKRFYYDSYDADPGDNRYGRLAAMEWEVVPSPPYDWQTHYWRHVFSYSTYGAVTRSKLVDRYDGSGYGDYIEDTLAADFSWTMQGEMWWVGYPSQRQVYYNFDSAGRPNGAYTGISWYGSVLYPLVSGTSYTKAGQVATLDAPSDGYTLRETRSYNDRQQLTGIQAAWTAAPYAVRFDLSYVYPAAGSNNGRISAEINNLTSTQVSYTYDQLSRLATAASATGGTTNWGLSFSYDVYGNRTAQTVTAGSAPAFSATFGSSNRMVGYSYDNNGNQLTTPDGATLEYDPDNRLTKWTKQGQVDQYQYHPSGWRLSKSSEKYLYGPGGQLLESYRAWNDFTDYVYFGGRLLYTLSAGQALTRIYSDRLGSTRATETIEQYGGGWTTRNYYPFGEEIGSTANDQYKFASTYRDSATGLDYAINRYYASGMGRFLTTDPYKASGGPANPQGLNRYTYAQNDPVNFRDPTGLLRCGGEEPCEPQEADPDALGGLTNCIWVPISQGLLSSGVWLCSGDSGNQLGTPRPAPKPITYFLKMVDDCYRPNEGGAGVAQRVVTYELWAEGGGWAAPRRVQDQAIWEHIDGDMEGIPHESPGPATGVFQDVLYKNLQRGTPAESVTQWFSVSAGSMFPALQIRGKDGINLAFPGNGYNNSIVKYDDYVSINGNTGGKYVDGKFKPDKICGPSQ